MSKFLVIECFILWIISSRRWDLLEVDGIADDITPFDAHQFAHESKAKDGDAHVHSCSEYQDLLDAELTDQELADAEAQYGRYFSKYKYCWLIHIVLG